MPFDLVLKSSICPTHYWEIETTIIYRGIVGNFQTNWSSLNYYENSNVVRHDNALPVPTYYHVPENAALVYTQSYRDESIDYVAGTQTVTNHSETVGSGDTVTIDFPVAQTQWGGSVSSSFLVSGDVTCQNTLVASAFVTPDLGTPFNVFTFPGGSMGPGVVAAPQSPAAGQSWLFMTGWAPYQCGNTLLINGREPFVQRRRYAPCDSGYLSYDSDFAGATENYHLLDNSERAFTPYDPGYIDTGDHRKYDVGGYNAWQNAAWGTTKTLVVGLLPPQFANLHSLNFTLLPNGTAVERKLVSRTRWTMTNIRVLLSIHFNGTNAAQSAYDQVGLDCFDDIVACCWQTAPSGGKKAVLIGLQRGLEKHIGTGSGSTAGWDIYNYGDIDERSPIGFLFLPNGWLFLSFNIYDGSGNATAYYTVNKQHGEKPASNWSAVATLTPNVAQALGIGRSMGQAFRTRVA